MSMQPEILCTQGKYSAICFLLFAKLQTYRFLTLKKCWMDGVLFAKIEKEYDGRRFGKAGGRKKIHFSDSKHASHCFCQYVRAQLLKLSQRYELLESFKKSRVLSTFLGYSNAVICSETCRTSIFSKFVERLLITKKTIVKYLVDHLGAVQLTSRFFSSFFCKSRVFC